MAATLTTKQKVGLEMLSEVRDYEFDSAYGLLSKILGNLVANPEEPKFRKLRTSNEKIKTLLATKGVRALLVGSGFVEEPDALNAEAADVAAVLAGFEGLTQLQGQRHGAAEAAKAAELEARNAKFCAERENREAMKARINDDATMRKEPGWKAQAAGSKESTKSITTAGDLGLNKGGG